MIDVPGSFSNKGTDIIPHETWYDTYSESKKETENKSICTFEYVARLQSETSTLQEPHINIPTAVAEQPFVRREEDELMKSVSRIVDKLTKKDEGLKVINKPNLLDEISGIVSGFTSKEMCVLINDHQELTKRIQKIMALEAMSARIARLPRVQRI
jgi:hypothetical protein